jgi:hypothetical protein
LAKVPHPFDAGCLPLSYSGNPGVNAVSYRGYLAKVSTAVAENHQQHLASFAKVTPSMLSVHP